MRSLTLSLFDTNKREQWLYRGYVTSEGPSLVGRWRDVRDPLAAKRTSSVVLQTFTPPDLNGYEVSAVLARSTLF